jgi:sulfur-oxidizing protein SoxX
MKTFTSVITTAGTAALLAAGMSFSAAVMAKDGLTEDQQKGKELAFARGKGNCLACHRIKGGKLAGNIGPALLAMKARYPDRDDLRAVIYDPREKFGDQTIMPPFGAYRILSDEEIDLIVDYIHTL